MNKEASVFVKLVTTLILIAYIIFFPITVYTNKLDAIITLIISMILLYKSRKNMPLFIMSIFIFYINYSIVIGEYIIGGKLAVPLIQVKNQLIYGITIRTVLLFMYILTMFYNGREFNYNKLKRKDNYIIFYIITFILTFILVIEIDRGGELRSYSVRISPIYEYSKILFLFAYYYSGKRKFRETILTILIIAFIIQDFYYGGRITSLQLAIFYSITMLREKITDKKIILFTLLGIVLNNAIGIYRKSYTLYSINMVRLIGNLITSYFVFDTATHAYYASATHIAASKIVGHDVKLNSLYEFIKSIVWKSHEIASDVTRLVKQEYFYNVGGGLIPTHFYFWLGWLGVILIAVFLVIILNNLQYMKSDYSNLIFFSIIINAPRWYLYSPNALFRGAIYFTTLLYLFFLIINRLTKKSYIKIDRLRKIQEEKHNSIIYYDSCHIEN